MGFNDDDSESMFELIAVLMFWFIAISATAYFISWNVTHLNQIAQNDKTTVNVSLATPEDFTVIPIDSDTAAFMTYLASDFSAHYDFLKEEQNRGIDAMKPDYTSIAVETPGADGLYNTNDDVPKILNTANHTQAWQVYKVNSYFASIRSELFKDTNYRLVWNKLSTPVTISDPVYGEDYGGYIWTIRQRP